MMQIEINRYTIMKLEEAITKYNKENRYRVGDYVDLMNRLLDKYCEDKNDKTKNKSKN